MSWHKGFSNLILLIKICHVFCTLLVKQKTFKRSRIAKEDWEAFPMNNSKSVLSASSECMSAMPNCSVVRCDQGSCTGGFLKTNAARVDHRPTEEVRLVADFTTITVTGFFSVSTNPLKKYPLTAVEDDTAPYPTPPDPNIYQGGNCELVNYQQGIMIFCAGTGETESWRPGESVWTAGPTTSAFDDLTVAPFVGQEAVMIQGHETGTSNLLTLILGFNNDNSTWKTVTNLPEDKTYVYLVSVSPDEMLAIGGRINAVSKNVHRYSMQSDSWTPLASMPAFSLRGACAYVSSFRNAPHVLCLEGKDGKATNLAYNIGDDRWTEELAPNPFTNGQDHYNVQAGVFQGRVIIIGGYTQSKVHAPFVTAFDLASEQWVDMPDSPIPMGYRNLVLLEKTIFFKI